MKIEFTKAELKEIVIEHLRKTFPDLDISGEIESYGESEFEISKPKAKEGIGIQKKEEETNEEAS